MTDEELFLLAQGVPPFGMGAGYATPAAIPMQYNTGRNIDPSLLAQLLILGQPAAGMQTIPQASQQFSRPSYQPLMTPETYQNFYANNRPAASIYSPLEVPRFERYVEPVPVSPIAATPVNRVIDSGGGYDNGGGYSGGFDSASGADIGAAPGGGISMGVDAGIGGPGGNIGGPADIGSSPDAGAGGPGGGTGGKIICTAMNHAYGFGSFRNAIWVAYSDKHLTKAHEAGYHTLFLPLVDFGFKRGDAKLNMTVRKVLEWGTRHRSTDLRAELRHTKRDTTGRIIRFIFEPLCYAVGKLKGY